MNDFTDWSHDRTWPRWCFVRAEEIICIDFLLFCFWKLSTVSWPGFWWYLQSNAAMTCRGTSDSNEDTRFLQRPERLPWNLLCAKSCWIQVQATASAASAASPQADFSTPPASFCSAAACPAKPSGQVANIGPRRSKEHGKYEMYETSNC